MIKKWLQDWLNITPGEVRVRFEEPITLLPELIPEGSQLAITYPDHLSEPVIRMMRAELEKCWTGASTKIPFITGGLKFKVIKAPSFDQDVLTVVAKDIAMHGRIYHSIKQITGA